MSAYDQLVHDLKSYLAWQAVPCGGVVPKSTGPLPRVARAPRVTPEQAPTPRPTPEAAARPTPEAAAPSMPMPEPTRSEPPTPAPAEPAAAAPSAEPIWKSMGSRPKSTFRGDGALWGDDEDVTSAEKLRRVRNDLGECSRCSLCDSRTKIVFGVGSPEARIMVIGEAPGYYEDQQGEPFVGKAGALLDKMVKAMGFDREQIYIANVLKCRPPENRDPTPEEVGKCSPFLQSQVSAVEPEVIVAMGRFAVNTLLNRDGALGKVRGQWHKYGEIPLMPTYHPAYLLRNPDAKRYAWDDLQKVMSKLGMETPGS